MHRCDPCSACHAQQPESASQRMGCPRSESLSGRDARRLDRQALEGTEDAAMKVAAKAGRHCWSTGQPSSTLKRNVV